MSEALIPASGFPLRDKNAVFGLKVGPTILGRPRSSKDARPYPMLWGILRLEGERISDIL